MAERFWLMYILCNPRRARGADRIRTRLVNHHHQVLPATTHHMPTMPTCLHIHTFHPSTSTPALFLITTFMLQPESSGSEMDAYKHGSDVLTF